MPRNHRPPSLSSPEPFHIVCKKALSHIPTFDLTSLLGERTLIGQGGNSIVYQSQILRHGTSKTLALKTTPITLENLTRFFERGEVLNRIIHHQAVLSADLVKSRFPMLELRILPPIQIALACVSDTVEFIELYDLCSPYNPSDHLNETNVMFFINSILQGVKHLHRMGIAHLDVKLDNLMITQQRQLVLIDLGEARFIHTPPSEQFEQNPVISTTTKVFVKSHNTLEILNQEILKLSFRSRPRTTLTPRKKLTQIDIEYLIGRMILMIPRHLFPNFDEWMVGMVISDKIAPIFFHKNPQMYQILLKLGNDLIRKSINTFFTNDQIGDSIKRILEEIVY